MKKHVLITGVLGGIGQSLAQVFNESGYYVIGLDLRNEQSIDCHEYIQFDLHKFCTDEEYRLEMKLLLNEKIP